MSITRWPVTVGVVLFTISLTSAYRNGAARSSCQSLSPSHGHNGTEIRISIPYAITFGQLHDTYTPGEPVTVFVASDSAVFTGLLIQARQVIRYQYSTPVTERTVGYFAFPQRMSNLRTLRCWSDADSVTQATPYKSLRNVTLNWMPPSGDAGRIIFVATVMKDAHLWYAGIRSKVLYYKAKTIIKPDPTTTLLPDTRRPTFIYSSGSSYSTTAGWLQAFAVYLVLSIDARRLWVV